MSSSPPAPVTENDEVADTVDIEVPCPGHAAESTGAVVDAGAAANHTVSSPHEVNDDPDVDEDMDDDHDEDGFAPDDNVGDDVGDVDDDLDEEEGKFWENAEVQATVEALWRKVVPVEEKPSAGHACSVCTEQLTCEGTHRICCIPCGHVYGRSCLQKCLRRDGNETGKCPQCGVMFVENHIINLYAPAENLWEGCGTIQEVKVYVSEAMTEVLAQCEKQIKAERARASSKIAKQKAEQRSYDQQVYLKLRELQDQMVEAENERRERMQSLKKAYAEMNNFLVETGANLKLINEHVLSLPPKAKPAEVQEGDALAKNSRARRIIKPNKRFYSNEWTR